MTSPYLKDDRTPAWFYRDGSNSVSAELPMARMKTHIETVVGRYRGRIAVWDVVNEALDDESHYFPWKRVNHPLLFDRAGKPKPAFDSVIAALQQATN